MNILVVDDEKEIADLVELYLKNENFHVFKFYNGCDALRCVETEDIVGFRSLWNASLSADSAVELYHLGID